jgi:hypothetical protein
MTDNVVNLHSDDEWTIGDMLRDVLRRVEDGELAADSMVIVWLREDDDHALHHGMAAAVEDIRDATFMLDKARQDVLNG